jgi:hypothetical protein
MLLRAPLHDDWKKLFFPLTPTLSPLRRGGPTERD